jgi:hypothetical protein
MLKFYWFHIVKTCYYNIMKTRHLMSEIKKKLFDFLRYILMWGVLTLP